MKPFSITSDLNAQQIDERWRRHLPFLKLQIYSSAGRLLQEHETALPVSELSPHTNGLNVLEVNPDTSVTAFEEAFVRVFGLRAQVLRKSGYTWDDIPYTKSWTLQEHNRKGGELSEAFSGGD